MTCHVARVYMSTRGAITDCHRARQSYCELYRCPFTSVFRTTRVFSPRHAPTAIRSYSATTALGNNQVKVPPLANLNISDNTSVRKILSQHPDIYRIGEHDGRPSVILRTPDSTTRPQMQQRLASFFDDSAVDESVIDELPFLLEIARNVYISSNGRMKANPCITIEFDQTVAGNSLDSATLESLALVFECCQPIASLSGILLVGAAGQKKAKAFSCGANIKEMQQLGSSEEAAKFIRRISRVCTAIRTVRAPVICGIDGSVLGAGLEIAASCDIRVATQYSAFAMPEVKLAIPSVVEARLLYDLIGVSRTKHLLLTSEVLDAETAFKYGLITKVFHDRAQMLDWCTSLFEEFSTSVQVHAKQKDLMRIWDSSSLEQGIMAGMDSFADRFGDCHGDKVRKHMRSQWDKLKSGRKSPT